ncbi:hypothetical protein ACTHPF_22080 [Paenibacillus sp. SAF-054]
MADSMAHIAAATQQNMASVEEMHGSMRSQDSTSHIVMAGSSA